MAELNEAESTKDANSGLQNSINASNGIKARGTKRKENGRKSR